MNKKIFRSSLAVAMFVALSCIVLIVGLLFRFFEEQIQKELKNEAGYIACSIQVQGSSYIDGLRDSGKRITLIAPDGSVIADTNADAATLDDHSDRAEFREAIATGSGTSVRYSKTLTEKTVYYAERLDDGSVLRVSTTQYSVVAILISLIPLMLFVLVIAAAIAFALSARVSRAIIKPINELDLNDPPADDIYEELTPLLARISAQNRTIDAQIEEAKKRQEEFRLITENMSEGLLVIDDRTNLLTYNRSALKLLGIESSAAGSALTLNRTKGFRDAIEKALGGDRAESEMSADDRAYSLIANPVYENKKVIGAVIMILDVTERVKNEQLRREFTSNISHELKTPLTSVSGFAEIMKSGGIPEETVIDFSQSIYDEAQRLISLVNDIIKLSELDERSFEPEKEKVDLYELSREIINRLKPVAEKKHIRTEVIGSRAEILGARKILDEVIYNLCDNAIKYNKENGAVDVIVSVNEKKVSVTVRDTGIGIPLAAQGRVFERFYRVDKSHSKHIGGTGLGLAIVKHGVLYHNGAITLDSTEGKGTAITVTFDKA